MRLDVSVEVCFLLVKVGGIVQFVEGKGHATGKDIRYGGRILQWFHHFCQRQALVAFPKSVIQEVQIVVHQFGHPEEGSGDGPVVQQVGCLLQSVGVSVDANWFR